MNARNIHFKTRAFSRLAGPSQMAMDGLKELTTDRLMTAQRCLELANKAYSLYVTRKPAEQAELLRKVLLNCSIDAVSVTPTYRKPFNMIFQRAKKEWSGREDLNFRPLVPNQMLALAAPHPRSGRLLRHLNSYFLNRFSKATLASPIWLAPAEVWRSTRVLRAKFGQSFCRSFFV
jgi:hypothetical protein